VDITTNYTSVDGRVRKLTNPKMKSMLKAIGIDFMIVVWEQDKTYDQISFEEQCRLASVVLAVDSMQITKKWVDELIISALDGRIH